MVCSMLDAFKSLPEDPDELRSASELMVQHIQSLTYQIEKLKAELHGHRKARFGSKVSVRLSRYDGVMECLLDVHHG